MPRDDPSILQANVCEQKKLWDISNTGNSPGRTLVFFDSDNMVDVEFFQKEVLKLYVRLQRKD